MSNVKKQPESTITRYDVQRAEKMREILNELDVGLVGVEQRMQDPHMRMPLSMMHAEERAAYETFVHGKFNFRAVEGHVSCDVWEDSEGRSPEAQCYVELHADPEVEGAGKLDDDLRFTWIETFPLPDTRSVTVQRAERAVHKFLFDYMLRLAADVDIAQAEANRGMESLKRALDIDTNELDKTITDIIARATARGKTTQVQV